MKRLTAGYRKAYGKAVRRRQDRRPLRILLAPVLMLSQAPAAPPAPAAPAAPSADVGAQHVKVFVDGRQLTSPQQVYSGLVHQRDELVRQQQAIQGNRSDLARQLNDESPINAADKAGMERRLAALDARIEAIDKQLAVADAQVASAAAVPGAVVEPPPYVREGPPEELVAMGALFMLITILPISLAFARRIWRRSPKGATQLPTDVAERFSQLDQAMESIAVEVERIGEGQRFITRVLSEQGGRAALGQGAAVPVERPAREAAEASRRSTGS